MKYYIYQNEIEKGPFDEREIEVELRAANFSVETLARRENENQWHPLSVFFPVYAGNPHSWMQNSENAESQQANYSYKEPSLNTEASRNSAPDFAAPQTFESPKPATQTLNYQRVKSEGTMPLVALIGGISCVSFMMIGLIPCFGWLNYLLILGAIVNAVLSIVAISSAKSQSDKNKAVIALVLTAFAICVGGIRLFLGFGCI